MTDSATNYKVILIDDERSQLDKLHDELVLALPKEVEVVKWFPEDVQDQSTEEIFESQVRGGGLILVVTDYDLTKATKGLFGLSIVGWCQSRFIPVGDFSRGHIGSLPKEPNLFELRVPINDDKLAASNIAALYNGFKEIRSGLEGNPELASSRSPAQVLAQLLGYEKLENQFAQYLSRIGAANSGFLDKLREFSDPNDKPNFEQKRDLLTYLLGHILVNAILKYPGPILSKKSLCAYIAVDPSEAEKVEKIFETARYTGPFNDIGDYYWRDAIDEILDGLAEAIENPDFETFGERHRASLEYALGISLQVHGCNRCDGKNGGFFCPLTERAVCVKGDCSVTANSWIPRGAQLCRIEKDFYDEWAPLLGL